jgi:response regulator RpfG family c-di-GMP phosphodiesterase
MITERAKSTAFTSSRKHLPTILHVDCDHDSRQFVANEMDGLGVRIVGCNEFSDAKAWLAFNPPPQVILMDVVTISDQTANFIEWIRSSEKLKNCNLVVFAFDLHLESYARVHRLNSYMPKGLDGHLVGSHLSYLLQSETDEPSDDKIVSLADEKLRIRIDRLRLAMSMSPSTPGERDFILSLMQDTADRQTAVENLTIILDYLTL